MPGTWQPQRRRFVVQPGQGQHLLGGAHVHVLAVVAGAQQGHLQLLNPNWRGPCAWTKGSACKALRVDRVKVSKCGSPARAVTRPPGVDHGNGTQVQAFRQAAAGEFDQRSEVHASVRFRGWELGACVCAQVGLALCFAVRRCCWRRQTAAPSAYLYWRGAILAFFLPRPPCRPQNNCKVSTAMATWCCQGSTTPGDRLPARARPAGRRRF